MYVNDVFVFSKNNRYMLLKFGIKFGILFNVIYLICYIVFFVNIVIIYCVKL